MKTNDLIGWSWNSFAKFVVLHAQDTWGSVTTHISAKTEWKKKKLKDEENLNFVPACPDKTELAFLCKYAQHSSNYSEHGSPSCGPGP